MVFGCIERCESVIHLAAYFDFTGEDPHEAFELLAGHSGAAELWVDDKLEEGALNAVLGLRQDFSAALRGVLCAQAVVAVVLGSELSPVGAVAASGTQVGDLLELVQD